MSDNYESALTYTSYLAVDDLLKLQKPLSDGPEHDEMLFIIIHQTYELWFKQLIHEFQQAQRALESGDTHYALSILGRIRTIMKVCVAQVDILETMTPLQFNAFRGYLSSSSGFQSAQFRKVEAILGRRDSRMAGHLPPDIQAEIKKIPSGNSIWKTCHSIAQMLIEKNIAYGDSALDPVRIFSKSDPAEQLKVRIDDKLSRLMKGTDYPGDNDIDDLIGYLVLLKIAKEKNVN